MAQTVLLLLPRLATRTDDDLETGIAGAGLNFLRLPITEGETVPLRALRACHAAIIHGPYPLPSWSAGLMENCRILVRSPDGIDMTDLRAFGTWGIPVCIAGRRNSDTPLSTRATRIREIRQRLEAARTVTLFLRDGFVRDCVNARWLRLSALRSPASAEAAITAGPSPCLA